MKINFHFKYIYPAIFCLSLIMGAQYSHSSQSNTNDHDSIEWENRDDVKKAVKSLKDMHGIFEQVVQDIYNAYAPYTVGKGEIMRERMKSLARLINALRQYQWIKFYYTNMVGSKVTFNEKMEEVKKAIRFHFFKGELSTYDIEGHNIISEVDFAIKDLAKDPKFFKIINSNSAEIDKVRTALYICLKMAVETIPDSQNILKYKVKD